MFFTEENYKQIDQLIEMAFFEDLKETGDVTSEAIFKNESTEAVVIAKGEGIICGLVLAERIAHKIDPELKFAFFKKDGEEVSKKDIIFLVEGKTGSILKIERVLLNFLGKLSGISSRTNLYVTALKGTNIKILDTRKTTPGYRMLEKYAVKQGGGENHRIGLFDMVLIKDNHIDAAGSITEAVKKVKAKHAYKYKIEVETRNLEEVKEALKSRVDIIMLDNMSVEMMQKAQELINQVCKTEVSGNITLEKIKNLLHLNIDYISTSDITVHAEPLDLSMILKTTFDKHKG